MNKYANQSKIDAYRRWRSCDRKKAFPNREAAMKNGFDVYQCRYCGLWHNTNIVTRKPIA